MLTKKYVIVLIVVLVLVGTVFWGMRNMNTGVFSGSPSPSMDHSMHMMPSVMATPLTSAAVTQNIIVYENSAFTPGMLHIKLGDTVIFKNNSSKAMQISSGEGGEGVHEDHHAYPELNAKRAYLHGEEYRFTFAKKGMWHYHNHFESKATGMIMVE